ncbi:protein of unknown function [Candidatus Filomicrobium marinum]|uniref:Uncharacterized protein n=1 Tax=Candidatus Filomicrobium marinum TaxID=1608628 RepID=A0A0D6JBK3_9HYPH|nr:protein of unknown function [Candidatus Filomicrobium marinum]CPR15521.1 protein of unknown function [Candidatus Filomicrobium marinum]
MDSTFETIERVAIAVH